MGLFKTIGNLLFVPEDICLFCRENPWGNIKYICKDCEQLIKFTHKKVVLNLNNIDATYYSMLYTRFVKGKIYSFKFQGNSYLFKPFGEILAKTIEINELYKYVDFIAFVPIHKKKQAKMGYNHSELLAKYISTKFNIPLLNKHLIKLKWTIDQNKLDKLKRKNNLKGAFSTINNEDFKGKDILLVDDIITTGATMEECGKVLLEGGAKSIIGLALISSIKI